jgi:hypothetical protein
MSEEKPDFLRRWSRLKKESAAVSPSAPVSPRSGNEIVETPVELPPLDSLTFESDFRSFMHAKVEESVKRAALKKLFADPRFNVMDGLDTYIDDYSIENPIPDEMMARLDHARQALFGLDEQKEETKAPEEKPEETASSDGDPAQDPKAL